MAIVLLEGFNGYYDAARYVVDTGSSTSYSTGGTSTLSIVSGVRGLSIYSGGTGGAYRQHIRPVTSVSEFCLGATVTYSLSDVTLSLMDADDSDHLCLLSSGGYVALRKKVGGSLTTILTSWPSTHSAPRYYEIEKIGTTAKLYINGFEAASTTGVSSATYTRMLLQALGSLFTQRFSSLYLTDDGTRLGPIKILPATLNADAENTGFTGTYTSVDEQPTDRVTDANYIWTDADGSRFTAFATAPFTGTALAYRATVDGYCSIDGLYDFRTLVKSGSEETEGDDVAAGYDLTYYNWSPNIIAETLPDGSELSVENFEDAEFGVSVTRNPDP